MEIEMKVNDNWLISSAQFIKDPCIFLEDQEIWISVQRMPEEWECTIIIQAPDIHAANPKMVFNAYKGQKGNKKYLKECEDVFTTDCAGTIRLICFILEQTYSFESMKTLVKKAAWWDAVHGNYNQFSFNLPDAKQAFDRIDMDIHTPLDKWVFYNNDPQEKSEFLEIIQWTLNTYAAPLFKVHNQHSAGSDYSKVSQHQFSHFSL